MKDYSRQIELINRVLPLVNVDSESWTYDKVFKAASVGAETIRNLATHHSHFVAAIPNPEKWDDRAVDKIRGLLLGLKDALEQGTGH